MTKMQRCLQGRGWCSSAWDALQIVLLLVTLDTDTGVNTSLVSEQFLLSSIHLRSNSQSAHDKFHVYSTRQQQQFEADKEKETQQRVSKSTITVALCCVWDIVALGGSLLTEEERAEVMDSFVEWCEEQWVVEQYSSGYSVDNVNYADIDVDVNEADNKESKKKKTLESFRSTVPFLRFCEWFLRMCNNISNHRKQLISLRPTLSRSSSSSRMIGAVSPKKENDNAEHEMSLFHYLVLFDSALETTELPAVE